MRQKRKGRVNVWQDKRTGKWRVQVTYRTGKTNAQSCATETLAREIEASILAQMAGECMTIAEAVTMYLAKLKDEGTAEAHQTSVRCRLRLMFPNQTEQYLEELHPVVAQRLYDTVRTKGKSVDYQRNTLLTSRSFCKWLMKRGDLQANPFSDVEGVGRRKRGKVQLTRDESRKFVDTCLADESVEVTAALCCLLLALRCGEIAGLTARSLDEGGTLLRIERDTTKSDAGARLLEVPAVLVARMPALAAATIDRQVIYRAVRLLCKRAGVTVVSPHALRGTHASLATRAGATSQLVAGALGHASTEVTEGHYTQAGAVEAQAGAVALRVLNGGKR